MNKLAVTLSACLLTAAVTQAAVIVVNGAYNGETAPVSGTLLFDGVSQDTSLISGITVVSHNAAKTGTIAYEISGLELGGSGVSNDSVVVTFDVEANANLTTAAAGWLGTTGNFIDQAADYITLSFNSMDVKIDGSSDAGATAASSFTGFDRMGFAGMGAGETNVVNGVEGTAAFQSFAYTDSITASFGAGSYRPANWSFDLEVIPEPATMGLVGLFGGGILFIRRMFQM